MKRTTLTALGALGLAAALPIALSVGSANGVAPAAPVAAHETGSDPANDHGNPHFLTFEVRWVLANGDYPDSLDAILPANWEDSFELTATATGGNGSAAMSAECVYEDETLMCTYVNNGNTNADGMMIIPKPGTTYTVMVDGVPTGWVVDASTVGTFLGEDGCPQHRGHGHGHDHDDDHHSDGHHHDGDDDHDGDDMETTIADDDDETTIAEDETTIAEDETTIAEDDETTVADDETTVVDDDSDGLWTGAGPWRDDCVHTVIIRQQGSTPTTTMPPTTVTPTTVNPTVSPTTTPRSLPTTGQDDTLAAALLAVGLVALGYGVQRAARRRPAFNAEQTDL